MTQRDARAPCTQARVVTELAKRGVRDAAARLEVHNLGRATSVLPSHAPGVRRVFERLLRARGVRLGLGVEVCMRGDGDGAAQPTAIARL